MYSDIIHMLNEIPLIFSVKLLIYCTHFTQGEGVVGAKIYLNGEMKVTTGSNGKYRLYNMTSGHYLFQASNKLQMIM